MSEEDIPEDIRKFLAEYIDSVVHLELLILFRDQPQESWTVERIAAALCIESAWTEKELEKMATRGLISPVGAAPVRYRRGARTMELDQLIARSMDAYENRRVSVIGLVYSCPTDAIRTFAEAFRVRKD